MSFKARSIFNDKYVVEKLTDRHNKYIVVPADKASNNIVLQNIVYWLSGKGAWHKQ